MPLTTIYKNPEHGSSALVIYAIAAIVGCSLGRCRDLWLLGNSGPFRSGFHHKQTRTDVGALWENFVVSERMKFLRYQGRDTKQYFWRTTQQQEIDLIEEMGNDMSAYEIKWNPKERVRFSQTFVENYQGAKTFGISPENLEEFLM